MIETRYGKFTVEKAEDILRENDRVRILITETNEDLKDNINNFIKDLGKFETYMNGFFYLLHPIPTSSYTHPYDLTHSDIAKIEYIQEGKGVEGYVSHVVAKTEKNTKFGKELKPVVIEKMIENIERYNSFRNTLKLFKNEIFKG